MVPPPPAPPAGQKRELLLTPATIPLPQSPLTTLPNLQVPLVSLSIGILPLQLLPSALRRKERFPHLLPPPSPAPPPTTREVPVSLRSLPPQVPLYRAHLAGQLPLISLPALTRLPLPLPTAPATPVLNRSALSIKAVEAEATLTLIQTLLLNQSPWLLQTAEKTI